MTSHVKPDSDKNDVKTNRQHKSHEYCAGYIDKYGIWNNGFYCPRWGGADDVYCCGELNDRFCCPERRHDVTTQATPTAFNYIPVVCAVSAGVLVVGICLLIGCFLCRCCPGYKRRKVTRAPHRTSTLSISMEAEATSAVIAAQALTPLQQSCLLSVTSSQNRHARCECGHVTSKCTHHAYTPDTVSMTTTSSVYDNKHTSWQHDIERGCIVEEQTSYRVNDVTSDETDALYRLLAASNRQLDHNLSGSSSSQLCLETFRPMPRRVRQYGVCHVDCDHVEPLLCTHNTSRTRHDDVDRQRRDSGVLVEEQDSSDVSEQYLMTSLPAHELIGVRPVGGVRSSLNCSDRISANHTTVRVVA